MTIKTYQKKAKFCELKPYDHFAKEGDYIEVTDWDNGEGFDVTISEKHFSLTHGEWECLQVLVNYKE